MSNFDIILNHPLVIILIGVLGFLLRDVYLRLKPEKFVTKDECHASRNVCSHGNEKHNQEIKANIKQLFEKSNCIDLKLARVLLALEMKGWLPKGHKDEDEE